MKNNTLDGLYFQANGAGSRINDITAQDITTTGNQQHGVLVYASNSGAIDNITLDTVTATSNQQHGVWVYATTSGVIDNAVLNSVTSTGNQQHGVLVYANNNGGIDNAVLDSVTSTGNQWQGVWVYAANSGVIDDVTLDALTAQNNIRDGLRFEAAGAGSRINGITAQDITATGNQWRGVLVYAINGGVIDNATLDTVTATSNQLNGVFINDDTTGAFNVDLGGGALGSLGNNSIYGNVGTDLRVDLDGGELKAQNNWWGDATGLDPARVSFQSGSTVDSSNFLTSAP